MSTLRVDADSWDTVSPENQKAAKDAAWGNVGLGDPAVQYGEFILGPNGDNVFTPDQDDPPTATRWYVWDHSLLGEDAVLAIAGCIEELT